MRILIVWAVLLTVTIGLSACGSSSGGGGGGNSSNNPSPATSPMQGQWEFVVTSNNALFPYNGHTYFIEADLGQATPSGNGFASYTQFWEQQVVSGPPLTVNMQPIDPDACELTQGSLKFDPNSPASGEFDYTLSASGNSSNGPANASANGAGTFTATTAEATYLSTESGSGCTGQGFTAANDSGSIQATQVQPFSGSWTGNNGTIHLTFTPSNQNYFSINISGNIGSLSVSTALTQYGAVILDNQVGFFREVTSTTDGYPAGQSGPAIYFNTTAGSTCNDAPGCSGVLLPSN